MGRTFALSDLHGQRGLWEQIKAYLQPEDKLYFLGDAIDRGPDGFTIMKEMMANKKQIVYIKGNHEQLMENALLELKRTEGRTYEELSLWFSNGGRSTYREWNKCGSHFLWLQYLRQLPIEATYFNTQGQEIRLCHAGFTPGNHPVYEYDLLWDREHYYATIPEDLTMIVVHGHTPNEYLVEDFDEINRFYDSNLYSYRLQDGVVFYENNQKIDIDCGCFATGQIAMLDLDTWETISFHSPIEW